MGGVRGVPGRGRGGPFCFLLCKIKGKRQAGEGQRIQCPSPPLILCCLGFSSQNRKSSRKTCLTWIPCVFFFFISSEMSTTLWSLHSAGPNPPLQALGGLIPARGCNLSTQAFLRALLESQGWMEPCSARSSITFITTVSYKENNTGIASRTQMPA